MKQAQLTKPGNFGNITLADFIVRAAYQMGKKPLLPLFAAALGAGDLLLGTILSVSTLTGMFLKPFIGILSDRWGRRAWLLLGTLFFAAVPFFYRFVQTPEQLFAIRIIHGTATAIYGPVTLAFVAEQSRRNRATRLGIFGIARDGGYVVGPAVAGFMLRDTDAVTVFTTIGLLSCAAFLPILLLSDTPKPATRLRLPILSQARRALAEGSRTPAIWLSGGLESSVYIATYGVDAFLPIYALAQGIDVAMVGLFFSVQKFMPMLLKPLGGALGDRIGHRNAIAIGMLGIGVTLPLIGMVHGGWQLLVLAALIGAGQALVFPATLALASHQISAEHMGAGMGLVGTIRNAGKVVGPIAGGLLVVWLDYAPMFQVMGLMLIVGAIGLWVSAQRRKRVVRGAVQVGAD